MSSEPRIYNLCGRVHLGPCCVNGGDRDQPICMHCGGDMDAKDRALMGRTWEKVHALLRPFKTGVRR